LVEKAVLSSGVFEKPGIVNAPDHGILLVSAILRYDGSGADIFSIT